MYHTRKETLSQTIDTCNEIQTDKSIPFKFHLPDFNLTTSYILKIRYIYIG